jgi:hypothetical protein
MINDRLLYRETSGSLIKSYHLPSDQRSMMHESEMVIRVGLRGEEVVKYEDWSGWGGGDYYRTKSRGVMGEEEDD